MGRVVKNGRTYPVQRGPDRLFVKQRNQIVRSIYDLGRVVKLFFRKNVGSLTHVFVNDPTKMCIVPIMQKYYSDTLAIVPINGYN